MSDAQDDHLSIHERLARIEGLLAHLATNERLARVEEQLRHIDDQMPQIARNAISDAQSKGWQAAKEDGQADKRAVIAIIVSILALLVSAATNFFKGG